MGVADQTQIGPGLEDRVLSDLASVIDEPVRIAAAPMPKAKTATGRRP